MGTMPASPQQMKAQLEEQLRVIVFIHGQKRKAMTANAQLIDAIEGNNADLSSVFTGRVVKAYMATLAVQNHQLDWEVENLQRDMDKIHAILAEIASPILRVAPTSMPVPPGPRNIR